MNPMSKFKKLNEVFSPRGFAVFDITGIQFAIAKDFSGMMVLMDEDCAQLHRTFNTEEWTQRFNGSVDTIWHDLEVFMEYKNGNYVVNREVATPFTEEQWREMEQIMREINVVLFEEEEELAI